MLTLSAPLSRTPATQQPALAPKIESVSSPSVSERRRSSNSHSFPGGNHTIDAHEIRDIVGFDYAWSHKDDGPPEPGWSGQRVVCVSQGSTGTHATFEAAAALGLPAAHWFFQHRAGVECAEGDLEPAKNPDPSVSKSAKMGPKII